MTKPFKFKQFSIWQDRSAMKVGTDGVLLGCFANPAGYTNCLDIGTGTGLLALMMAQKNEGLTIQAIEIDEDAYKQAKQNIKQSKWKNRVEVAHISLQQFKMVFRDKFDFIISNPPYYEPVNEDKGGNLQKQSIQRKYARATGELNYETLISSVKELLADAGVFNLVIPYSSFSEINNLLTQHGFYITRMVEVRSYENTPIVRVLIEASREKKKLQIEELTIYAAPTKHTREYINYTKDYYLGTGKHFN